jgi:hypothetical protein
VCASQEFEADVLAEYVRREEERAERERERNKARATVAWRQLLGAALVKVRLTSEYGDQAQQGQQQGKKQGKAGRRKQQQQQDGQDVAVAADEQQHQPDAAGAEGAAVAGVDYEAMGVECEEL